MIHFKSRHRMIRIAQSHAPWKAIGSQRRNVCRNRIIQIASLLFLFVGPAFGSGPNVLFRENFDSIARWEPLTFPKIEAHTSYTLVKEGGNSILKTESRASASAIVYRRTFNIYDNPRIRWRWKVDQLSDWGDPGKRPGTTILSGSMSCFHMILPRPHWGIALSTELPGRSTASIRPTALSIMPGRVITFPRGLS